MNNKKNVDLLLSYKEYVIKKTYFQRVEWFLTNLNIENILITSSFSTQSIFLLKIISELQKKININIPVYFIDTGFHFEETLEYKNELSYTLGLKIIDIKPNETEHKLTKDEKTYLSDTDRCCFINKVTPLNSIIGSSLNNDNNAFLFWMTGLMRWQTNFRKNIDLFDFTDPRIIKINPFFDLEQSFLMQNIENLPKHPLLNKGYFSIGCSHCTSKGSNRNSRWFGEKQECGIHKL